MKKMLMALLCILVPMAAQAQTTPNGEMALQMGRLSSRLSALETGFGRLTTDQQASATEIKKFRSRLNEIENMLGRLESERSSATTRVTDVGSLLGAVRKAAAEERLSSADEESASSMWVAQLQEAQTHLGRIKSEIEVLRVERDQLVRKINSRLDELETHLGRQVTRIDKLEARADETDRSIERIDETLGPTVYIVNGHDTTLEDHAKKIEALEKKGDWSLGVGVGWTGVYKGPQMANVEGSFNGNLRMAGEWLYFAFKAGPGIGWINKKPRATLTEFVGFEFRKGSFTADVGGRHRVAFLGGGDSLNALMGEFALGYKVGPVLLSVSGGIGGAWFPRVVEVPGMYPAGVKAPTKTIVGDGLAGEAGFAVVYKF